MSTSHLTSYIFIYLKILKQIGSNWTPVPIAQFFALPALGWTSQHLQSTLQRWANPDPGEGSLLVACWGTVPFWGERLALFFSSECHQIESTTASFPTGGFPEALNRSVSSFWPRVSQTVQWCHWLNWRFFAQRNYGGVLFLGSWKYSNSSRQMVP